MKDLNVLLEKLLDLMENVGYSDGTIKKCRYRVTLYIKYLSDFDQPVCLDSVNDFAIWLTTNHNRINKNSEYYFHDTITFVNKFLRYVEDGTIYPNDRKRTYKIGYPLGESMIAFINHLHSIYLSYNTIRKYKSELLNFNKYMKDNTINNLNPEIINQYFIDLSKNNPSPHKFYQCTKVLKKYFEYTFEEKIFEINYSKIIPKAKYIRSKELPSTYTETEIDSILKSVDKNSKVGKRDYAMLLLVIQLGLRCKDVVDLKFSNIDWENSIIRLTMSKTKKEIKLPLLPEIGNAIIDYLRNSRRKTDLQNIFIPIRGPISPLDSYALYNVVKRYINMSKIETKGRKKGPHAFRHSLATQLLKKGESLEVISEVLGHSSTQVTTVYTSVDIDSLRKCALEIPAIKSPIYMEVY